MDFGCKESQALRHDQYQGSGDQSYLEEFAQPQFRAFTWQVQGVFFRDSMRRLAQQRNVSGWASNRPDGTVEAVLEGDDEAVERLVDFAHRGPRGAQVESVEVTTEEPEGLTGFSIR